MDVLHVAVALKGGKKFALKGGGVEEDTAQVQPVRRDELAGGAFIAGETIDRRAEEPPAIGLIAEARGINVISC